MKIKPTKVMCGKGDVRAREGASGYKNRGASEN